MLSPVSHTTEGSIVTVLKCMLTSWDSIEGSIDSLLVQWVLHIVKPMAHQSSVTTWWHKYYEVGSCLYFLSVQADGYSPPLPHYGWGWAKNVFKCLAALIAVNELANTLWPRNVCTIMILWQLERGEAGGVGIKFLGLTTILRGLIGLEVTICVMCKNINYSWWELINL